jgi:transposase-like protein
MEPAPATPGDDGLTCPWCGSDDVEQIGTYGSLLMTSQWFCDACGSPFERIRHRSRSDG